MSADFGIDAVIRAVDKFTGPARSIIASLSPISSSLGNIGRAAGDVGARVSSLLGPLSAVAGAGGLAGVAMGVKGVVGVSAQFEKFTTILETVEGSSEKAKASMAWVSEFAAKTPYELAEVTDAFVKLKAYGIDAQAGALDAAGNAAAAMGKDINQAVEALADALTGENERLKEFGIKASTAGNTITYAWNENGKQMVATANKNSAAQIEAVVTGIWNRRYGGAMDKLSTTWTGMWSNLMDTFTQFGQMIGDAGLFEFLKGELSGLLGTFQDMKASGALKELAGNISSALIGAIKAVKQAFAGISLQDVVKSVEGFGRAVSGAVEWIGGLKNALIAVGVVMNAGLIVSMAQLVGGIGQLAVAVGGVLVKGLMSLATMVAPAVVAGFTAMTAAYGTMAAVFMATGIGAIIVGLGALAWTIYENWEPIKAWFLDLWAGVEGAFAGAMERIRPIVEWIAGAAATVAGIASKIGSAASAAGDWVGDNMGWMVDSRKPTPWQSQGPSASGGGGGGSPLLQAAAASGPARQAEANVTVRFEGAPAGTRIDAGTSGDGMQLALERGMALGGLP